MTAVAFLVAAAALSWGWSAEQIAEIEREASRIWMAKHAGSPQHEETATMVAAIREAAEGCGAAMVSW